MKIQTIGYLSFRTVDSIRYNIYNDEETNKMFYYFGNKKYLITLPKEYMKLNNVSFLSITLSDSEVYVDFLKELNDINFPKYYLINNNKILNNNFNKSEYHIELPDLKEIYSYKSIFNNVKEK